MKRNIGVLGGDLRIVILSKMLVEDGYNVYTYGVENTEISEPNIIKCKNLIEMCSFCDTIISGIPFSKDGVYVNTPFSNKKININDILRILSKKTLVAGAINSKTKELANENNVNIIDLMKNESFAILNVIPTVEGAIQVAMENTDITIHNSNCLVLGFGRVSKALCKNLKFLGANVSAVARKQQDLAWMQLFGYKDIYLKNLNDSLKYKYDIIFNTIPAVVLKEKELLTLKETNRNCIIIELASSPGGVDLEKAKEYSIKVIYAQGLPGKVAPATAAKYIKETLENCNLLCKLQ